MPNLTSSAAHLLLAALLLAPRASHGSSENGEWVSNCSFMGFPDLHFTPADLFTPNASADGWGPGGPAAGKRAYDVVPSWAARAEAARAGGAAPWEAVHHALYLPTDWVPSSSSSSPTTPSASSSPPPFPLIVEFTGNGPWNDSYQDVSTGLPEWANMGYGISGGKGFLWLSLPFLDLTGQLVETYWWGCDANGTGPVGHCPGEYFVNTTLQYMKDAVRYVTSTFNGDPAAVFLTGWSRGALATDFFGLYDDEAAALWAGLLPYSHFDGRDSDQWVPYPDHDPASAIARLKRLNGRPLFITEERNGTLDTAAFLNGSGLELNATLMSTGFCNHNDQWTLRPSPARDAMRAWVAGLVGEARRGRGE
jgi:hypothetical protein